jgi:hypothetical protein
MGKFRVLWRTWLGLYILPWRIAAVRALGIPRLTPVLAQRPDSTGL